MYMYVHLSPSRPQIALKIIVPKMRHEDEKVAMLSLTVSPSSGAKYHSFPFGISLLLFLMSLCLYTHSSHSSSLSLCSCWRHV